MTYKEILAKLTEDPGLPSRNPTTAYWQLPPHPTLANIQSTDLPTDVDYAIIGSGISGCSIAKHLLESDDDDVNIGKTPSVCVFEARTICSGATGRNGGGLSSFAPFDFPEMCETYGVDAAVEIARFTYRTLAKMHEMGDSDEDMKREGEIRRTREVMSFRDEKTFVDFRKSILLLQELVPEADLDVGVLEPEKALKDFGVKAPGGCVRFNCGAFWPYRFITTIWSQLLQLHGSRLSIETNTPVTGISFDPSKACYIVETPRGPVHAKKVIHATNAHASHLIPSLRDKIFPVRGYMSAQQPGSGFGKHVDRSWSSFGVATYDAGAGGGMWDSGIYYGNQSPNENTMFWGCDAVPIDEWITADDSGVPEATRERVSTVLPQQFTAWEHDEKPVVRGIWSGIMGYTADNLPLVGKVDSKLAGRGVDGGEWICAGFNGAGMYQCWSSGEAVVKMMAGQSVQGLIPASYLMTSERLSKPDVNSKTWLDAMLPSAVDKNSL